MFTGLGGMGTGVWSSWTTTATTAAGNTADDSTTGSSWTIRINANDSTQGTTNGYEVTWANWVGVGGLGRDGYQKQVLTSEKIAREARRQEELRKQYEKEEKKRAEERAEAQKKALALLLSTLSPVQKKEFEKRKVIPIKSSGGKEYEIAFGRSGNVVRLDEHRKPVERFCIHPIEDVPDEDTMLCQKLWLEHEEEEFLKVANKTVLPLAA